MTKPEWQLSEQQQDLLTLLEYLHDRDGRAGPVDYVSPDGIDSNHLPALASTAESLGYVISYPSGKSLAESVAPLRLEGAGIEYVARVRAAQSSRKERNAAARQALLLSMYEHGGRNPVDSTRILGSNVTFYGVPFTEDEVNAAAEHLTQRDLITGNQRADGAYFISWLTADGERCVEDHDGDVRANDQAQRTLGPTNTQVFHGDFSGQNAQGSHSSQIHNSGLDVVALREIFTALRGAVAALPQSDDRDDLEVAVDDLERDVSADHPDGEQVRRRFGTLRRAGNRAVDSAAVVVGTTAGSEVLPLLERLAKHLA